MDSIIDRLKVWADKQKPFLRWLAFGFIAGAAMFFAILSAFRLDGNRGGNTGNAATSSGTNWSPGISGKNTGEPDGQTVDKLAIEATERVDNMVDRLQDMAENGESLDSRLDDLVGSSQKLVEEANRRSGQPNS